ncbi:DUF4397 domain-containing protein [candidate division KSB1 bacterium]|nr:DUF4397 domain-containing protein [candidate division KSB1 bacterium]
MNRFWIVLLLLTSTLFAQQTAKVQVIHNAADPAAAVVDVYLGETLLLDDLGFRTATPFVNAPAGEQITITIAPGNSTSVTDGLASFDFTLNPDEKYIVVANGVLNPANFAANPDGKSTGFDLYVKSMAREEAQDAGTVDLAIMHGATDAPTVDVMARDVGQLVDDASYTDFTDYLSVPPQPYLIDLYDETGQTLVATFDADLSALGGGAALVFASGFMDPDTNRNGEAFGLFAALADGQIITLDPITTARVQVIHNAADPGAAVVDVYLGETRLLDNFAFRSATPFIDAPAAQPVTITIAPGSSSSVNDGLASFDFNLIPAEKYIVIANGVLNPDNFAANPDGKSTAFDLYVKTMARETSDDANMVDLSIMHGATDAPTVDVIARNVAQLVDNAAYADITDYLSVPPQAYLIGIFDQTGENRVATFSADLSGLGGGAAFIFASGFLTPDNNQGGAAFGLYAALPNGQVLALNERTSARVQVIHNAADPAAAVVDVYLGEVRLLNDFAFRAASPFIDAPANEQITITIAPGNSASVEEGLASFDFTLIPAERYIIVANGVLNPAGFAKNPDEQDTAFDLYVKQMAKETADDMNMVNIAVMHGATDAPTVDIMARDVGALVDDASYTDITSYLSVPPQAYLIDLYDQTGETLVATFNADLSTLTGGAAFVFASGFLNPAGNQDGAAFGLYAALPDGQVLPLDAVTTSRVQVIHNAADPAAAAVDVYLGDTRLLDDFAFRTATPFIDAPANELITITIAPGNSSSVNDGLASFDYTLMPGEKYVLIANGVLDPSGFAANPDAQDTGFNLYVKPMAREEAMEESNVEFFIMHGATDAPTVDIIVPGAVTLADDLRYGSLTDYISVGPASYRIDIQDQTGSTVVASYQADLTGLAGESAVVYASGFFAPASNQNGQGFAVYVTLADGTTLPLPVATSVSRDDTPAVIRSYELSQNYPNPFNPTTQIRFNIPESEWVTLSVYDVIGRKVAEIVNSRLQPGSYNIAFDATDLTSGLYYYRLQAGSFQDMKKMMIVK